MARIDNRGNLRGSAANSGADVKVTGAEDFYKLSRALKLAGESGLRNELHKAVRDAAKPLIPKIREASRANLPKQGKLNERIAKKPYRAQERTGAKTAGVRITGAKVDPRINESGRVYHPVFGRPGSGVVQHIPAAKGYFDQTIEENAGPVRDAVLQAMEDFGNRLIRRV